MKTDVAIERAGIETVLVERDPVARLHIGESRTGERGQQVVALGSATASPA